jgi:hypothetical protein
MRPTAVAEQVVRANGSHPATSRDSCCRADALVTPALQDRLAECSVLIGVFELPPQRRIVIASRAIVQHPAHPPAAAEREDAVRASNACHTARVFADEMRRPIDVGDLRARLLAGASSWHTIELVAETGSTNADLIARAVGGEDVDGEVLIAEHQTAGRGRNGRSWSGVPGAQITMSVGVNADGIPPAAWGWLPLVAGLSVLNAVDGSGVRVGLKWPNDVLASPPAEGKVAGILAEVASPKPMVVIGIG